MSRSDKIDLLGRRFGMWTVVAAAPLRVHPSGCGQTYWRCRCDCGAEAEVNGQHLREGKTSRCRACRVKRITRYRLADGTPLMEAAAARGVNVQTVYSRLRKGASPGAALSPPPRGLTLNGETRTVKEWCARIGISPQAYYLRRLKGLTPEEAATLPKCPGGNQRLRSEAA